MAPLAPRNPDAVWAGAILAAADEDQRHAAFGGRLPELAGPLTLAQTINATLADAMAARPEMMVFGEDVARKGGVYGVTRGLLARFGAGRVFDTLLDEQAILGLALGAGLAGLLPVPEIQYLAYLHNAADQIRGEARHLALLLPGPVPQPDGGADRRLRLPGGLRRALPQRQRGGGTAGHPGPDHRLTRPARGRRRDAAHLPGRRGGGRQRLRVPGADRAVPHPGPVQERGRRAGGHPTSRPRAGRPGTCRSAGPGPMATAPT